METPDPDEEPLGTVRAYAAPRDLPPRAPPPRPARTGPVLLVLAVVVVLAGGGFVAWHFANRASSSGSSSSTATSAAPTKPSAAPAGRTTASKKEARPAASRSRSRTAASPSRRFVVAVADILALAGTGRAAARHGDWAAALRNRQATLARVSRVPPAGSPAGSLGYLRAALRASIQADRARVNCGCGAENPQDVAATELKRRFLDGFNPLASRYLRRSYAEPDI